MTDPKSSPQLLRWPLRKHTEGEKSAVKTLQEASFLKTLKKILCSVLNGSKCLADTV